MGARRCCVLLPPAPRSHCYCSGSPANLTAPEFISVQFDVFDLTMTRKHLVPAEFLDDLAERTTQFGTGGIVALRFRDWTGLGVAERAQFSATAESLARCLEPRLNAFVMFENGPITPTRGVLGGMPYAAKDIFVSTTRLPHGGLSAPLPMSNAQRAAALDLMDR